MQSSPPRSEGKARAIRELSRSLNGHSPRSIPSPSPPPSDSNPTQQLSNTSNFWNNDDVLMSTQHRIEDDTNTLPRYPRIRSTAKKVGSWQMLQPEQPIDTSMVNKQFGDFDHSASDEDDVSVEQGRGGRRSNRSTPGKVDSSLGAFNSLYDLTPPSARPRKSIAAETGSLRRDAQIRRASRNDMDTASPRPASMRNSPVVAAKHERKRTSLAQSHAKVSEDESSFMDARPDTITYQSKSTRWGAPRSRQTSLQLDSIVEAATQANATPRSRPVTAQTGTAQSFMLPDLPNLTELVSGVFQDGTPVFSKSTPARSRFAAPNNSRGGRRQPNYIPIDSVPIPDEEKAIFAALQLLQDKVSELESERAEAEKKIEDQELEIIELKATTHAQENARQSGRDSGLGSTDGEGSGRGSWKIEKTRLESSVQTLQKKLERAERKLSVADIEKNRIQNERENMATQLSVAFQKLEEVKGEKEALTAENETLRQEVDALRTENDALRDQLEHEQEQYREETVQLRRQVDRTENITQKENETLRIELNRIRTRHDENTQQLARKEVELRKARKEQTEFAKLKTDNQALKEQLAELKAKREQEVRRWSSRESELKGRVDRRDETIRHFQDMTQEQTNEAMRLDNENLRHELAQLAAQHDEEARRWSRKQSQLKRKVDAAKEKEGLTREILSVRQANGQESNPPAPIFADKENTFKDTITSGTQRKPSLRREDTRTRIANRVQQEVRNSKAATFSQLSGHNERSPKKLYNRLSSTSIRATQPEDLSRSVSAPVSNNKHAEVDSDVESTTDLSPLRRTSYAMHGAASGMPSTNVTVEPPAPLDLTELSLIDADQIAQLRRQLEEERAGVRFRAASCPLEREVREDTVRSVASVKSTRQQSLPRKSSLKDMTEKTSGTVFEDLTGRVSNHEAATAEPTQNDQSAIDASMLSNTSRRRRSAPIENMTSAFIVPDIKLASRKEATTQVDATQKIHSRAHDNDNCTVCRREGNTVATNAFQVPRLVPASSRMPDDVDATLRPSRSPKEALALVVKELLDERAHLHLELATCRAMLEAHDVSMGMRKRQSINNGIQELLRLIEVKDTQIYHLYDVLEGQADHEITEQDVEELTREIRVEKQEQQPAVSEKKDKSKGKEKKVYVQSYHDSDESGYGNEALLDDDLPWEGFEDTGTHSVNFGGLTGGSRRSSVYQTNALQSGRAIV